MVSATFTNGPLQPLELSIPIRHLDASNRCALQENVPYHFPTIELLVTISVFKNLGELVGGDFHLRLLGHLERAKVTLDLGPTG